MMKALVENVRGKTSCEQYLGAPLLVFELEAPHLLADRLVILPHLRVTATYNSSL